MAAAAGERSARERTGHKSGSAVLNTFYNFDCPSTLGGKGLSVGPAALSQEARSFTMINLRKLVPHTKSLPGEDELPLTALEPMVDLAACTLAGCEVEKETAEREHVESSSKRVPRKKSIRDYEDLTSPQGR